MTTRIPSFHDGYVTGVCVEDECAELSIKRVDGDRWKLILAGLEMLQMDDFRQGNIISHVEVVRGGPADRGALERLCTGPHPSAAQEYHDKHAQVIERMAAMVEASEATLLMIIPSYGADLVAICRDVSFAPVTSLPE